VLWVRREGNEDLEPHVTKEDEPGTVAAAAKFGTVVFAGEATAPFLGVEVTSGPGICEARFTLSTTRGRWLDAITLAPLYFDKVTFPAGCMNGRSRAVGGSRLWFPLTPKFRVESMGLHESGVGRGAN
jgi:hypothetical protein